MKVGIWFERSGLVRDAFIRRGHDAVSCDLVESDAPGPHIVGDALEQDVSDLDLLICHPPCTYLCNSGVRWLWNGRRDSGRPNPARWHGLASARRVFLACLDLCRKVGRGTVENPIPHGHADLPPYDQIIQPWMFGDAESKATCLWLIGLRPLMPTHTDAPLWGVYDEPKQIGKMVHRCPPGPERARIRSTTFPGIASAMADQWGGLAVPGATPNA